GGDPHPGAALLGGLAGIEDVAGELEPLAAALVDGILGVDQLAAVVPHPTGAEVAAGLLVGEGRHDYVAVEAHAAALEQEQRRQLGRDLALHVDGAAPVNLAA